MAMESSQTALGAKAPDFDLDGTDGSRHRLADLRGPKGTLVMFICNHCPYVQAVLDDIIKDARELQPLGIATVAIMPNDTEAYPDDSFDSMKRLAQAKRFPFPYLIDRTQAVARAYDAACTPDFFGFNIPCATASACRARRASSTTPWRRSPAAARAPPSSIRASAARSNGGTDSGTCIGAVRPSTAASRRSG